MVQRIKSLIAHLGLSTRAFALSCGLRQNTLNNQLNGMRELSLSTIIAILDTFPEVSSEWLLRGEGEMLKGEVSSKELERINKLNNIIESLQDVIDARNATIASINERILQLESQLNTK
ncbi:MAG: helix-turn-helix transcriptional regulator [Bacteroidales bacterium]|nr:helix-turn-helix transcriptional regulator [Bacteroidales bacterium]